MSHMELPLTQIDAFTDHIFSGNPAAVVHLPDWPSDTVLQSIAAENNLSETAFLVEDIPADAPPAPSDGPSYHLRWFTPAVEVDLCGHATLAAGAELFLRHDDAGDANAALDRVEFWTRSGWLSVTRTLTDNGTPDVFTLDFPTEPPVMYDAASPSSDPTLPDAEAVAAALGISRERIIDLGRGGPKLLCVVDSPVVVRDLSPDLTAVKDIHAQGVIVTAFAGDEDSADDVVSRFFAPAVGVNEDPVTGSAHTVLGPYWMGKLGKSRLACHQASARGGDLVLEADGDRILISGHAVRYLTGTIVVPD